MKSVPECPLCSSKSGIKHTCAVCHRQNCRECCKHYLALKENPVEQELACDECYLEHVAWESSRSYDVFGPETGKPVVLVHGALVGQQCLVLEAKALAEAGFRVIVPDLPAHGSRFKEQPLTLDNAVSTLYDVIQKEAAGKKVVMMGFSMGGYVAAAFAAAHPELLAGVLLGACCHDAHTLTWQLVGRMGELIYKLCSDRTKAQFMYKSFPGVMSPQRVEIQECFLRAGADFDAWQYVWRVMHDANMHKLLPKITCPALLVVGEKDYRSHEKKWLSYLQRGSLLVLRDGIHQFMFQPGVCLEFRKAAAQFAAEADWNGTAAGSHASSKTPQCPESVTARPCPAASEQSNLAAEASTSKGLSQGSGGVGVGTVVWNVLAQLRPGHRAKQTGPNCSDSTSDGRLVASRHDTTAL